MAARMGTSVRSWPPPHGRTRNRAPTRQAWGPWLPLAEGGGLDAHDKRALLVRRTLGGRTWGTTSVSLVALRRDGVRYDFNGEPGDERGWTPVVEG